MEAHELHTLPQKQQPSAISSPKLGPSPRCENACIPLGVKQELEKTWQSRLDPVVSAIPGLVHCHDGRPAGYIPKDGYHFQDDSLSGGPTAHDQNVPMLQAMAEMGTTERWWRYVVFQRVLGKLSFSLCFIGLTLGLGVFCLPCILPDIAEGQHARNSAPNKSSYTDEEVRGVTTGYQRKGWQYHLVPEIGIDWALDEMRTAFLDSSKMLNVAAALRNQRSLAFDEPCAVSFPPEVPPTAPGGEWARTCTYPPETLVTLAFSFMWIITFTKDGLTNRLKYEHGVELRNVRITDARNALLKRERDIIDTLYKRRFQGTIIPIWPPANIHNSIPLVNKTTG